MKQLSVCAAISLTLCASYSLSSKSITVNNESGTSVAFYVSSNGNLCGDGSRFGIQNKSTEMFTIKKNALIGCDQPMLTLVTDGNINASSAPISKSNNYSCVINPGPVIGCKAIKNDEY